MFPDSGIGYDFGESGYIYWKMIASIDEKVEIGDEREKKI